MYCHLCKGCSRKKCQAGSQTGSLFKFGGGGGSDIIQLVRKAIPTYFIWCGGDRLVNILFGKMAIRFELELIYFNFVGV